MSILNFSNFKYVQKLGASELKMGAFSLQNKMEIEAIRALLHIHGAGSADLRMNVYSDVNHEDLLFRSDWVSLSDIDSYTAYWLGWLRFEALGNANAAFTYYAGLEAQNYAESDSFFIAGVFDYPAPVYDNSETNFNETPIAIEVYGVEV